MDKKRIENAIKEILLAIGEDIEREGLVETPKRVANMYEEIFSGLSTDPKTYLKAFSECYESNEIIIIKDIPMHSVCEHHLMPFYGFAHIAYIPKDNKILGISKFARIVNVFAKRLQVQERITNQIADFIFKDFGADAVAVFIESEHLCMTMRGVKAIGSKTQTCAYRGLFKTDSGKQNELNNLMSFCSK